MQNPRDIISDALIEKGFYLKHNHVVNGEIVDYWVNPKGTMFSIVIDQVSV